MLTSNSSGNMQRHGYLGCFLVAFARENISWVWVIETCYLCLWLFQDTIAHYLLQNCSGGNITKHLWWQVSIGSGLAWCRRAASHYLSQCWPRSMLLHGVPRPHWVNSLWPSDAIGRQGTESALARVMACCLTAPSHYLNQCWLMISEVLWHSTDSIFKENTSDIYRWNELEIY